MAAFNKFQPFVEALAEGKHNFQTDVFQCALSANATPPVATNATLSQITQIAYTNLSTQVISMSSSAQSGGTYKLVLTDLVLTASGAVATFRWVTIFDQTSPSDELICFFDYGSDVTLANGETFTLDFDGTNGLLQIV